MEPRKWDSNILYETPPNPFHPPGSFREPRCSCSTGT